VRQNAKTKAGRERPGLWFGPGLLLAVIAVLLAWRFAPRESEKPRLERTPVSTAATTGLSAPEPAWLLAHRDALGLAPVQVARLDALQARWQKNTQPIRAQLETAGADFARSLPAGDGRGVTIQQVREQATPVSERTRQLLAARRAWWGEAAVVLTPAQKQEAERAWAQRFTARAGGGK
jgi:hypothetical protein